MVVNSRTTASISSTVTKRKNPLCNNTFFDGADFTLLTTIKIAGNKATIIVTIIAKGASSK